MALLAWLPCLLAALYATTSAATPARNVVKPRAITLPRASLNDNFILSVGDPSLHLDRRQSISVFQSNASDTFTPLVTQRWTISIDAQIQAAVGDSTPAPTCTLQICLANGACGAKRGITDTWFTFSFVTRMKALKPQTAIFINSCSQPARIALRNIATPDRVLRATTTALLGIPSSTEPPETSSTSLTDVSSTSSSASPSVSAPATQPSPLPQDSASTRIRAINLCEHNRPILVSVPENPDYMLITESGVTYDLGLESGNDRLSFTPLNGQALCPTVTRTGPGPAVSSVECSRDAFTYAALPGDIVSLDCASGPGPAPDLFNAVDIKFQTSGSCPAIIRQLGCQASGDMCLLDVYEGTVDSLFKWLRGSLRIKAIGEGWTSASLQVTAPNRATVSYMQDRGSSVTIDQDLLVAGTVIQIECDAPLQPQIFPVDVLNLCTRQPLIQVYSLSSAQVQPGATAQVLVSSDRKLADVFWGGYFADHSVCVTRRQTAVRRCGNDVVSTNELDVGDTLELDCPISTVYANVVNLCPAESPAIFGTASAPESVVLRAGDSSDFNVPVGDASVTFTPLGGSRMCALATLGTVTACGTDGTSAFQLTGIVDQDIVQLFCPDAPAPLPDLSTTIPLSIITGYACPNLLVQIGCEGSYCQGLGYVGGSQNVALAYPMLSPAARLRVRVLGAGSTSINWAVSFGPDVTFADQVNPQWLDIAVPDNAAQITLRTSCTTQPPLQRINAAVVDLCPGTTLTVTSPTRDSSTLQYQMGVYLTTYLEFPRYTIDSSDGRTLCMERYYGSANNLCGASPLTVDGLTQEEVVYIRCDGSAPFGG